METEKHLLVGLVEAGELAAERVDLPGERSVGTSEGVSRRALAVEEPAEPGAQDRTGDRPETRIEQNDPRHEPGHGKPRDHLRTPSPVGGDPAAGKLAHRARVRFGGAAPKKSTTDCSRTGAALAPGMKFALCPSRGRLGQSQTRVN